ncbi:MmgE/PrpD family protein [Actinophytocola sp.]|uniref:MmgE/PrpD family protein n=1 Tax=Actinophytocola sp. TaxID=1872138 RepID=UPI003D6B28B1
MSSSADALAPAGTATGGPEPLEAIANFAVGWSDFPDEVIEAGVRAFLDVFGVAVAGASQEDARGLLNHVWRTYARGPATALGIAEPLVPEAAAYANSVLGHVLDYDDHHDSVGGHPTVVVLPAVVAVAESLGRGAREVLEAYAVGVETMCGLGRCLNHTHYEKGWHPTATLGIFGATAAVARLVGLDVVTTVRALAIAASFASGIKGNFGTAMKPVQVGFAASKAVQAVSLAGLAASANPGVFTGVHSFPTVYNGQPVVDWSPLARLGMDWEVLRPGLVFKLYPCCGSTHAPIDAALRLRAHPAFDPDAIRAIEIRTHPRRLPHIDRPRPTTPTQARFSVQYVVAVACADGAVGPLDFAPDRIADPRLSRLLAVTSVGELEPARQFVPPGRRDCFSASVTVTLESGEQLEGYAPCPRGMDPAEPLATEELEGKFLGCVSAAGAEALGPWLLGSIHSWAAGNLDTATVLRSLRAVSFGGPGAWRDEASVTGHAPGRTWT